MNTPKTLPKTLYHASPFNNESVKPGIAYTGKLHQWDGTESNRYVYASSSKAEAVVNGIASCVENLFSETFELTRMSYSEGKLIIEGKGSLDWTELCESSIYLYMINGRISHGWVPVNNQNNGSDTEWKTSETIAPIDFDKVQIIVGQVVSASIRPYISQQNGGVTITTQVICV